MPYRLIWEPGRVIVCLFGSANVDDGVSATREWQADARFDTLRFVVYDCRAVDSIAPLNSNAVEAIAVMNLGAAFSNPRVKVAIVSPDGDLIPSVAAVSKLTENNYPIRLFSNRSDADKWTTTDDAET